MATKEELLQKLSDCVIEMEDEEVVDMVKEYIDAGFDPEEGLRDKVKVMVGGAPVSPAFAEKIEAVEVAKKLVGAIA